MSVLTSPTLAVLSFGTSRIVIRDCLADKSNVFLNTNGFSGTVVFEDRRWRWSRYTRVSRHYNERNADGEIINAARYGLRDILRDLFTQIGEGNVDVSRVRNDFYPEVDVECVEVDKLIAQLTSEFAYEVCLGFGLEPVRVWPRGIGFPPPSDGTVIMAASETLDPPTNPRYVQTCFGRSIAQARLKLLAVGLDTNGQVKPLNNLSYTPTDGWSREPVSCPNVLDQYGAAAHRLAKQTVWRWYVIDTYADGTLNNPDGSGTLNDISQLLPLYDKLLEVQHSQTGQPHHPAPRVYGAHVAQAAPGIYVNTAIGAEIEIPFRLDRHRGIVQFERPVYQNTFGKAAADVWLECSFSLRDVNTRQFVTYVKTNQVDPGGFGYHTFSEPSLHPRTLVYYNDSHVVTGFITNQAELDNYANSLLVTAAGEYVFERRNMTWFNQPNPFVRLDGRTTQIRHVISDGTDGEPGHYTVMSQNMDFDQFVRGAEERVREQYVKARSKTFLSKEVLSIRNAKGND